MPNPRPAMTAVLRAACHTALALYMGFVFVMFPMTLTFVPLLLLASSGFIVLMARVSTGALFAIPFTAAAVGLGERVTR